MTVLEAIERYLAQPSPEPHLAIQEPDLTASEMSEIGFEQNGEYWIISFEDAKRLWESLQGVDYGKHWEWERSRDDFRLGQGS
jgi:hypothetical protein